MITVEQAHNAVSYLEAAAMHMQYEDEDHKAYNIGMRQGAEKVLREFINQYNNVADVAILYEYKLQREDGKFLDKDGTFTDKGKTYKNRLGLA